MQTATGPARTSGADGASERVEGIGGPPGELLAGEVAVGRRLAVDRPREIEIADDRRRPEVEDLPYGLLDVLGIDRRRAERLDHQRDGVRRADRARAPQPAPLGQAAGD